jgi:hypothetical protein
VNTYSATSSITKARYGAAVQVAQVLIQGISWDVIQTENYKIKLLLPEAIQANRLVDAPFLHDMVVSPAATTLGVNASVGDVLLEVSTSAGFPESGIVQIDAAGTVETISYTRYNDLTRKLLATNNATSVNGTGDSIAFAVSTCTLTDAGAAFDAAFVGMSITIAGATTLANNGTFPITAVTSGTVIKYTNGAGFAEAFAGTWFITGFPVGATKLYVNNVKPIYRGFIDYKITSLVIESTPPETVTISSIDLIENSITISATTAGHTQLTTVRSGNIDVLFLDRPLKLSHFAGVTVDVYRVKHAGTDLEDGRIFTADVTRFQGKYLWSFLERVAERTKTTLAENVSAPTYVVQGQQARRTALEVRDASLFNATTLPQINIGRNLASSETRQVNAIKLRSSLMTATLGAGAAAGALAIQITVGSSFPEAWGYRVFIKNTLSATAEEVVIATGYNPVTHILSIENALVYNHSINEVVQLMADVLTVDALINDQEGLIPYAQRRVLVPAVGTDWASNPTVSIISQNPAVVEELRSYITVASAAAAEFDTAGGFLKLNFGRDKIVVRSQLAATYAAGVAAIVVDDGSLMPAANFSIILGEGIREAESFIVSTRVGNTLNLPTVTIYPHRIGEWVAYLPGEPEEVYYTSKTTGGLERFNFSPSIVFANRHLVNEPVAASRTVAIPSKYGTDYPFYLPSSWADRLKFIFDLARAAGVEVVIVSDR